MLKWLRKYNTYILVVGGCLLMVAFLLGGVLPDLSRRGFIGGTAMRVNGKKVNVEKFQQLVKEYHALAAVLGNNQMLQFVGGGESDTHWVLLTMEAEKAGLIGGARDGMEYLDEIASQFAETFANERARQNNRFFADPSEVQLAQGLLKARFEQGIKQMPGKMAMTEDQVYEALAKLRGVVRLQNSYFNALRYSDRRLVAEARKMNDSAGVDYAIIPAEREFGAVVEPDEAAIKAHYERFKDTPKGGGDFGIGYKLPARIKLEWLELNRRQIIDSVSVDPIEVERRLLKLYPDAKAPEGKTIEGERARIENTVKLEIADKVMNTASQTVTAEIAKATRKLTPDGAYYVLPANWNEIRPNFEKIRDIVVTRVQDQHKITIPGPKVVLRNSAWVETNDVPMLEGIGSARLQRGQQSIGASEVLFNVREIAGKNDFVVQVGLPGPDALQSAGNRYFFTILDARKESAPDSIDEVRGTIVTNIKRLAGYEILKSKAESIKSKLIADGIDATIKAPDGATGDAAVLVNKRDATVSRSQVMAVDQTLDTEAFRNAVMNLADALDPRTDVTTIPASSRSGVVGIDKALGLAVYQIKRLTPLTIDRYRTSQGSIVRMVAGDELEMKPETNPYAFEEMVKRMNVELDDRLRSAKEKDKAAPEPKS